MVQKTVFLFQLLSVSIFAQSVQLKFIDEYVLKDSLNYRESIIGGLSGIDKENDAYYMVVDDSKEPRVFKAKIDFVCDSIQNIGFVDVVYLRNKSKFFRKTFFDLESVFVVNDEIHLVSEGSVNKFKDPEVFSINNKGELIDRYAIPKYFKIKYAKGPRHNAVFEASAKSVAGKGFWVAMEGVMKVDGEEPSLKEGFSPARVTLFDFKTKKAMQQFAYPLGNLERPLIGRFNVNGITALLEYKENHFFVVERSYQSDYGIYGNKVKIYKVVLNSKTINTLNIVSIKEKTGVAVQKELLFDFDDIRDKLTENSIDNVEGITFGPRLSNGNQSLIVVTDDNFQKFGKQLNQFIVLEIVE